MGYDTHQDLLDALKACPAVLEKLLQGYSAESARTTFSEEDGWTVVEVVCHLRDAEERAVERMRLMRDQERPAIAGYDQAALAVERNYKGADVRQALSDFNRFRGQHVEALAALPAAYWDRRGVHAEMGEVSIFSQALHMAAHDKVHLAQIARI